MNFTFWESKLAGSDSPFTQEGCQISQKGSLQWVQAIKVFSFMLK